MADSTPSSSRGQASTRGCGGRGSHGSRTQGQRRRNAPANETPASQASSTLRQELDGYAMMHEENAVFYAQMARIEEQGRAAQQGMEMLKTLRENHKLLPADYTKILETRAELRVIEKQSNRLYEKQAQNCEETISELKVLLDDFKLSKANDQQTFDSRVSSCNLRLKVESQLREFLDGPQGLSTETDTPQSLAKELQKRNDLLEKQVQHLDSARQEMVKVTSALSLKPPGAIDVDDHMEVVRWQRKLVDDIQTLQADKAKLEGSNRELVKDKQTLQAEVTNMQVTLDLEKEEKRKAHEEATSLREEIQNLRESQVSATVSSSAEAHHLRTQLQQLQTEKDALADKVVSLTANLSSEQTTRKLHRGFAKKAEDESTMLRESKESLLEALAKLRLNSANSAFEAEKVAENLRSDVSIVKIQLGAEAERKQKAEELRATAVLELSCIQAKATELEKEQAALQSLYQKEVGESTKKDKALAEKDKALTEKDKEIAEKAKELTEKVKELADVVEAREELEAAVDECQVKPAQGEDNAGNSDDYLEMLGIK